MQRIGAAWIKKKGDKEFISCVINLPFLGSISFVLFNNEKKEKDNHPDYTINWSPDRDNDSPF